MAEIVKDIKAELKETDKLIALGLVIILGISIFLNGTNDELSKTIAIGLIGYLGRGKVKE